MNIKQLLVGPLIRLKYVNRFSTCRTLHKESVAEHAFFTGVYAYAIGEWIVLNSNVTVDLQKVLFRALIHDMEECITGDIPRDFKHENAALKLSIEHLAEQKFKLIMKKLFQGNKSNWHEHWKNAKDDSIEGKIVSFADFLSVISYIYEETRIASSAGLKEQLTSLQEYYALFTTIKYVIFEPLVEQVGVILKEIFNETNSRTTKNL